MSRTGRGNTWVPNLCFQDWFCFLSYDSSAGRSSSSVKAVGMGTAQQPVTPGNKSHGASLHSGPKRSLPTFRQLHGGENIWGGRSDCRTWKKVMSEISKITRASPAWNYRCIDLYFLTSSDDLKTDKSVLTMSKGKKTSKLKNTSTKSYIRKMILFPHFSA